MIYAIAYAAVALFCWGWLFAWMVDADGKYEKAALCSLHCAVFWPIAISSPLFWAKYGPYQDYCGWRLPYLERLWRRK